MMNRAKQLAIATANQQQARYIQQQKRREEKRDRQTQFQAVYQGYDADQGLYRLKTVDGSTIWAQSITSGGVAAGSSVVAHRPHGVAIGFMKGMPR